MIIANRKSLSFYAQKAFFRKQNINYDSSIVKITNPSTIWLLYSIDFIHTLEQVFQIIEIAYIFDISHVYRSICMKQTLLLLKKVPKQFEYFKHILKLLHSQKLEKFS